MVTALAIRRVLLVAVVVGSLYVSVSFWASDACLDAGGVYAGLFNVCSQVAGEHQHAWSRPWTFWVLAMLIPAVVALSAFATNLALNCSQYTRAQQFAQVVMAWSLPVVGPVVVHWFAKHGTEPLTKEPTNPYPREPELPG